MISSIICNTLNLISMMLEKIYHKYLDFTFTKNYFKDNIALVEGDPTDNLVKNIIIELIKKNIHIILIVDNINIFNNVTTQHLFHNDILFHNSKSTIHTINKSNIYTLYDRIRGSYLDKYNCNVDILILNHIIPFDSNMYQTHHIEKYTTTSIITRQILPDMITQSYGKIVYIEPHKLIKIENHSKLFSNLGVRTLSESSRIEMDNHNINVSCVKGPNTFVLSEHDAILIAKGVGDCLDYGLSDYSTEPLMYDWWTSLVDFLGEGGCGF
jgi:hypothetical protein